MHARIHIYIYTYTYTHIHTAGPSRLGSKPRRESGTHQLLQPEEVLPGLAQPHWHHAHLPAARAPVHLGPHGPPADLVPEAHAHDADPGIGQRPPRVLD